jgi:hypothetical protein
MRAARRLISLLALALAVGWAWPAEARYTARTQHICLHANYAERELLADRGDGDAIYCSAVWHAVAYADETRSDRERRASLARAFERYRRAVALGYDFDRIAMFGKTFAELIADGERLDGGAGTPSPVREDFNACMARIGVLCAAQCAGNVTCQAACNANNAWRCKR